MLSLPYVASAIPEIYSTLKYGVTTPVGRQLAAKAALSTLGGEAMYQATESGKSALNNSRIGNTDFNIKLAQPFLSAVAVGVDPDALSTKFITKEGVELVRDVLPIYAKSNIKPAANHTIESKFGDDILLEAFPFNDKYAEGLDPSVAARAKDAYEQEMMSVSGLMSGDRIVPLSGKEIVRRGLAKQSGIGNDVQIFLSAAPVQHLEKPKDLVYAAGSDPGFVHKYLLTDNGTTINGFLPEEKAKEVLLQNLKIEEEMRSMLFAMQNAKTREEFIQSLRYYKYLSDRHLSPAIQHNLSLGDGTYKNKDVAARAKQIGERLLKSTEVPSGSKISDIKDGAYPLFKNFEFEISRPVTIKQGDKRITKMEKRIIEPVVLADNAQIVTFPQLAGVMGIQKTTEGLYPYLEKALSLGLDPEIVTSMMAKASPKSTAVPNTLGKFLRYKGSPAFGAQFYAADATFGQGPVPILTMDTSQGYLKGIGASTSGLFDSTPAIIRKHGGILKNINKNIKKLIPGLN